MPRCLFSKLSRARPFASPQLYNVLPQLRKSIVEAAETLLALQRGQRAGQVRRRGACQNTRHATQRLAEFAHADPLRLREIAQTLAQGGLGPVGMTRQMIAQT